MNKCCLDPACSHAVVEAASLEAIRLTDQERQIILEVLRRNEQLQREQQQRILRLKAELQNLRRKGALKASADFDSTGPDPERSCGRCRVELGRVINRGAYCRACRLKVCKGCREYSFRTTDWVCTVCHKHMEIQAASGEWMNEFVRRPSRRRDNRVYVPAADVIKRTIRRSWTISNPTPRWNSSRDSPEIRPYNSLPRGQDISNYPSLIPHQVNKENEQCVSRITKLPPPSPRKHSPAKRSHSEDVYVDARPQEIATAKIELTQTHPPPPPPIPPIQNEIKPTETPPVRVNPLIKFAAERRQSSLGAEVPKARKRLQPHKAYSEPEKSPRLDDNRKSFDVAVTPEKKQQVNVVEKRVSFDDEKNYRRSLDEEVKEAKIDISGITQVQESKGETNESNNNENGGNETCSDTQAIKEEPPAIELCDIEPISGTVFRKVTVRRRGQDMRKISTSDNDDVSLSEAHSSPMLTPRSAKSATPSPIAPNSRKSVSSASSQDWITDSNQLSISNRGLSVSMSSIITTMSDNRYYTVPVKGKVEFGLQYNYKTGAFEILVKQCRDLAAVDTKKNHSNPYVKVYLLPDKSKSGKRKTSVKKNTLNPVFDDCLKFHIALNSLETRTLWLSVWHSDTFGRNDFLGEVMMPLENKVFDDPTPKLYDLQERNESMGSMPTFKGDILVGLKFIPPDMTVHKKGKRSRGALHVKVKEAKCLTAVKANGTSDPFCKSYLLPDKGKSSKQKTSIIKKTVNPAWNHTFIYDDVTLQELAERCLELTIWDHDTLGTNTFLGSVRFSLGTGKHYGKSVDWMDASGKEVFLWKSMLERPTFWVEGCLSLRPTRDQRSSQ